MGRDQTIRVLIEQGGVSPQAAEHTVFMAEMALSDHLVAMDPRCIRYNVTYDKRRCSYRVALRYIIEVDVRIAEGLQ